MVTGDNHRCRYSPLLPLFFLFILVFSAVPQAQAASGSVVVANTKDWRELYLLSAYGTLTNTTLLFFTDLSQAEVVMKMIDTSFDTTVYEPSSGAVVKNYQKYLEINGKSAKTVAYDSYADLQEKLFAGGTHNGYLLLDPQFGIEAVSASPLIKLKGYAPLFLTSSNLASVKSLTKGSPILMAGRFPIRLVMAFDGEKITGTYDDNAVSLVTEIYNIDEANKWGIIAKIDKIDLEIMREALPTILYYGELDPVLKSLNDTPRLVNFEVISGEMADMARSLEKTSGRDLKFILKFAQTYTNFPGRVGKLYDLNTVPFDYPIQDLRIEDVKYYPNLGVVAITFKNYGNIDVMFFTAVEFGGNALLDSNLHSIGPGQALTIPYDLPQVGADTVGAIINTRYGMSTPFKKAITAEDGSVVIARNATSIGRQYLNASITLLDVSYDDTQGVLYIRVKNPNTESIKVFGEVILGENSVLTSTTIELQPGETATLKIETPYLTAADFKNETYQVKLYYGQDDTLLTRSFTSAIVPRREGITGLITLIGSSGVLIPIIVVIIIALVVFFLLAAKRRKKNY